MSTTDLLDRKLDKMMADAAETKLQLFERLAKMEATSEAHTQQDMTAHAEFRKDILRLEHRQEEHAKRLGKLEVGQATVSVRVGLIGGVAGGIALIVQMLSQIGVLQ